MSESPAQRRFRETVVQRRTEIGMTQRELADAMRSAGVPLPQSSLAKIEKGTREPKVAEIAVLSQILGFSLDGTLTTTVEQAASLLQALAVSIASARGHAMKVADTYIELVKVVQQNSQKTVPEVAEIITKRLADDSDAMRRVMRVRAGVTDERVRDAALPILDLVVRDLLYVGDADATPPA